MPILQFKTSLKKILSLHQPFKYENPLEYFYLNINFSFRYILNLWKGVQSAADPTHVLIPNKTFPNILPL